MESLSELVSKKEKFLDNIIDSYRNDIQAGLGVDFDVSEICIPNNDSFAYFPVYYKKDVPEPEIIGSAYILSGIVLCRKDSRFPSSLFGDFFKSRGYSVDILSDEDFFRRYQEYSD